MKLKSWLLRSISGVIYVGIIVSCIFLGTVPFSIMAAVIGIGAVIELKKICEGVTEKSLPTLILDATGIVFLVFGWLWYPLLGWIGLYLCRMVLQLYVKNDKPIRDLAISLMTQIYIGLPISIMTFMGKYIGLHFILAIFLLIWINDTGAFVVGTLLGKHRLFERISPKKSWEGFYGGIVFTLLTGWLFAIRGGNFWDLRFDVITWLIFALVVTIFSTCGDLVESLMKRSLHIKDSGNIIPGHGGILDRIDSLLLVMPAVLIFIIIYSVISSSGLFIFE